MDVLLIDDDSELVQSLAKVLSPRVAPLSLGAATTPALGDEYMTRYHPAVVVLDLCLDERIGVESGFALLQRCVAIDSTTRVIVLTGHGSVTHGVRAITLGAASFVEKPAGPEHLAALIIDAASQAQLRREFERLSRDAAATSTLELIGKSRAMSALRERIAFVASTPQPVLLTGETGTGKGLCARLIHECSSRRNKRFVHYQPNFGGGDLIQSELFGHLKGAFTGATETRAGLAVEADGGTLFLDELDEVPADAQVRLLDLIQEQRVRAVGADSFRSIDTRCIAATNRPLEEALSQGRIRRDLYHRLAHNVLAIPPLRERTEDIDELCEATLRVLRSKEQVGVYEVTAEVLERWRAYSWPGNVRELQAVVENAAYHAHFKGRVVICADDIHGRERTSARPESTSFHDRVERFKIQLVEDAITESGGSQAAAARLLGLDRGTLRRILGRSGAES